jgi:hypothetical protein
MNAEYPVATTEVFTQEFLSIYSKEVLKLVSL